MDPGLARRIIDENIRMHERDKAFYDSINPYMRNKFAQDEFWKEIDFIISNFPTGKVLEVLDCAAGTGNLALKFLSRGHKVTAVDVSAGMLEVLQKKAGALNSNLKIICQDLDSYFQTCQAKYDVVSFCSSLHHLPNYLDTVRNAVRALNPAWYLYITFEPARSRKDAGKISKMIESLDVYLHEFILYRRYSPFKIIKSASRRINKKILKRETSQKTEQKVNEDLAEYYAVRGGIDDVSLAEMLKKEGMEIMIYEFYCIKRLKPLYYLAKLIGKPGVLRLIAKRL